MLVVCGYLLSLGIHLSTLSAQFPDTPDRVRAATPAASRAGRRGGKQVHDPAEALAASYSRYSSDLQDESSIDQQQRKCRERAVADRKSIPAEFEFSDSAVSGTKRERAGLNALMAAAEARRFSTVYFESLSRLARESVITMPMLKQLVYVHRVRIVSVTEGIDSSQNNWELMANFMAWVHEQFLKALRAAVLRGQEDAILQGFSNGDWCFGYGSEPIPGSERGRRGRNPKPRKRLIINPEHAAWVKWIFHQFVVEGWTIGRIARELTRRGAPKDHRAHTPGWHRDYVTRVLQNEKYVGIWAWGRNTNVRNPFTGQVCQEGRSPEEVAKWTRVLPALRLIDDDLFNRAQVKLDAQREKWTAWRSDDGRLTGPLPDEATPRNLLQRLVKCGSCGGPFLVCGANARYMGCSKYPRGLCDCKTYFLRATAEAKLLELVGDRILKDPKWADAVIDEAGRAWEERRQQAPSAEAELARQIEADRLAVARLAAAIEGSDEVVMVLADRLTARTRELRKREVDLAALTARQGTRREPPTREWVEGELRRLGDVLGAGGPDANLALRRLVGGGITVREYAAGGRKRKFLVGTFTLSVRQLFPDLVGNAGPVGGSAAGPASGVTYEVSFRAPPKWADLAQRAKDLFDTGLEYRQIADRLRCRPGWVPKALAWWHQERGLPAPDGRKLVGRLNKPKRAETLADQVKALWDDGLDMQQIGDRLGPSAPVVTAALKRWFSSHGLPYPDNRRRWRERQRAAADGRTEAAGAPAPTPEASGLTAAT